MVKNINLALKNYCKDNGYTILAVKLGHRDTTTIQKWVTKQSIPSWQQDKVKYVLIKEKYLEE